MRNVKLLSRGTVVVGAVACLALAGCSSEEDSQTEPTLTQVSEADEAESGDESDAELEDVDPDDFVSNDLISFDYVTGESGKGMCLISGYTDDEEDPFSSVTCTGEPPEDAPNVEVPPHLKERPSGISIDARGVLYTRWDNPPPAPGSLEPGQRVTVDDASCEMSDSRVLSCAVSDSRLKISGDEREVSVVGDRQDSDTYAGDDESGGGVGENGDDDDADDNDSQILEHYEDSTDPVEPGTTCGAATGNTLVEVREGSVSCVEAQEIIDEYRDRRESEGGGNTLAMEVDDWNCSSPTAGRSHELQAAEVCDGPEGRRIATPAATR